MRYPEVGKKCAGNDSDNAHENCRALYTGKEIRRRRKKLNLTQADLAERVYTSQDAISRIERGLQDPPFQFLCAIAAVLSCTPNDLCPPELGFATQQTVPQNPLKMIMEALNRELQSE